jgi:DNA sulfur modification protein DndD
LEELARRNKRTVRLYAKRRLVLKAMEMLNALLDSYEKDARRKIEEQINDILEEVAHKDYRCRFNDNFGIELILNDKATPKSAGENQLLSLAFIAALVRFAADRVDADDLILKPGIVAPLVLDAPLGQLDPSYQESVAGFLPKLAQQVVLLVSGSQGGERVLEALEPHVGAEYLLVQENKGARGKKQMLQRVIRGHRRDLILYGRDHTMTHIERLA